jgi:hypothetical protein
MKKMIFKNNKVYDVLKWCCIVVIPAMITFFGLMGDTLEWSFTQPVVIIASGFNTMLGTILGIGNIRYNKAIKEE